MKNYARLFGLCALVAAAGFFITACEVPESDPPLEERDVTTVGKLTITGLTAHINEEISAIMQVGSTNTWLCAGDRASNWYDNDTIKSGSIYRKKITGDSVDLKVFQTTATNNIIGLAGYTNYNGNDSGITISVNNKGGGLIGTVHSVSFTSGIGAGVFTPTTP
jgi:hypothetical protein